MTSSSIIDHTRGLCGKPDVPNNTPREIVEENPAHCLCCGNEMEIEEMHSTGMQQAGMYILTCTFCTEDKLSRR